MLHAAACVALLGFGLAGIVSGKEALTAWPSLGQVLAR
jgi:hypothetical protein